MLLCARVSHSVHGEEKHPSAEIKSEKGEMNNEEIQSESHGDCHLSGLLAHFCQIKCQQLACKAL
jgi:hypothetical protein